MNEEEKFNIEPEDQDVTEEELTVEDTSEDMAEVPESENAEDTTEVAEAEDEEDVAETAEAEGEEDATEVAEAEGEEDVAENAESEDTEVAAESEDTDETADGDEEETGEENPVENSTEEVSGTHKTVSKGAIVAAVLVIVLLCAVAFLINYKFTNKGSSKDYNANYVDVYGITIGEIADQNGMEYADFLERYGLPADLPEDVNSNAAENLIPLGKYAELTDQTLDDLKEKMGWDDSFTEETTLGEALDRSPLSVVVGEESLEQYKKEYELGDDVTADTLYGEIRHQVELKNKEEIDKQKAEAEAAKEAEEKEAEENTAEPTEETKEEKADK